MSFAMDRLDTILVNSPVKRFGQRFFEFPVLDRFLKQEKIDLRNKVILDAGCGAGFGMETIYRFYAPKELHAFDIIPEEVELAKKLKIPANVFLGNVLDTKLPDEKFDAAFIFEVLHHVPKWRDALREMNRIMKPGAALLIIELSKFGVKFAKTFFGLTHPMEASFEWRVFLKGLKDTGFTVKRLRYFVWQGFGFFLCVKN